MNTVQKHYANIFHNDYMWLREETMSVKKMLENYIHESNNIVSLCVEWKCFIKYIADYDGLEFLTSVPYAI